MKNYDVIIAGAGAAGILAASRAASLGARVLLAEKMERAGRKLLITGKGRCNITNRANTSDFYKHIHPGGKFLKHAFSQFFTDDIIRILEEEGVPTVVERGERVFPQSNRSFDVVQALMNHIDTRNTDIWYRSRVEKLVAEDDRIIGAEIEHNGETVKVNAPHVILATGGSSYPATGSNGDGYRLALALGHTIEAVRPALVPLETSGDLAAYLQGLSLKNVNVSLWVNGRKQTSAFGEMLFTHFGLSGPVILTLSRLVVDELRQNNRVELSIDLKPALDEQKLDARLLRDLDAHGKKRVDNIFRLWLPTKLVPVFLSHTGIDAARECHQVNGKERKRILMLMKDLRFHVSGHRPFKEAIITAGGVRLDEIDSKTMESKRIKGLYFAGEIIDLDADTGGYNLQIAWSTAWLAASACCSGS